MRPLYVLPLALLLLAPVAHADAVDDLAPGAWYQIPNSKLRDVCPPNDADYDWHFHCQNATGAWSGGTVDTTRGRLLIWGGGHADYKGNEIYAFDFAALSWSIVWGPTPGAQIPSGGTHDVYDDGNPGSRHTYSGLSYVPTTDSLISMGGSLWQSGFYSASTWAFSFKDASWSKKADETESDSFGDPSVFDPVTGHVFRRSNRRMQEYDPVADTYTARAESNGGFWASNVSAALDPDARLMVIVGDGRVDLYHLDTDKYEQDVAITGANAQDLFGGASPGVDFDPAQKKFVLWHGGLDVYTFDPVARSFEQHPTSGDDPGPVTTSGGVFGRFRYVPSRNVFARVNDVDEDVYVFRLAPGKGTPVTPPTGSGGASGGAGGGAAASGGAGGGAADDSGSCGCRLAPGPQRQSLWLVLGALLVLLGRRRRNP
jgi:MYXO-CTERM domain-containing protein